MTLVCFGDSETCDEILLKNDQAPWNKILQQNFQMNLKFPDTQTPLTKQHYALFGGSVGMTRIPRFCLILYKMFDTDSKRCELVNVFTDKSPHYM